MQARIGLDPTGGTSGIATNANSERAVKNASMASAAPGTVLRPLGMSCESVGGADFFYDGTIGQQGVQSDIVPL